jgi:hypothetical protein
VACDQPRLLRSRESASLILLPLAREPEGESPKYQAFRLDLPRSICFAIAAMFDPKSLARAARIAVCIRPNETYCGRLIFPCCRSHRVIRRCNFCKEKRTARTIRATTRPSSHFLSPSGRTLVRPSIAAPTSRRPQVAAQIVWRAGELDQAALLCERQSAFDPMLNYKSEPAPSWPRGLAR